MWTKSLVGIGLAPILLISTVLARTPAPEGAQVYIISPVDGETVVSPVTVRFGLKAMGVAPAGIDKPGSGHHHLLINVTEQPALDKPLPANDQYRHFGGGQTEAAIILPSGKHTLQLIMGDQNHIPHDPPVLSEKIQVIVK